MKVKNVAEYVDMHLRLERRVHDRLRAYCDREGIKPTAFVRQATSDALMDRGA